MHKIAESPYLIDQVPEFYMRRLPDDPRGGYLRTCLHCRMYERKKAAPLLKRKLTQEYDSTTHFICTTCKKVKNISDITFKLNGDRRNCCKTCANAHTEKYELRKQQYETVRMETIFKNRASCVLCERIYIKNDSGYGVRWCTTKDGRVYDETGKQYTLNEYSKILTTGLELRILEFDHLTESEMRNRGLLKPDEPYVRKNKGVGQLHNLNAMRVEARKCQLICSICHTKETQRRFNENRKPDARPPQYFNRREYVRKLKLEIGKCTLCGYFDETNLRYFEFDHIDPTTKIDIISVMMMRGKYTMEDLKKECAKCRLLCLFCHRIHSTKQQQEKNNAKRQKISE